MKSATKDTPPTLTVSVPTAPAQLAALRVLTRAAGDQNDGRVAAKALALGLFVLGVDQAGDFALDELTDQSTGRTPTRRERSGRGSRTLAPWHGAGTSTSSALSRARAYGREEAEA